MDPIRGERLRGGEDHRRIRVFLEESTRRGISMQLTERVVQEEHGDVDRVEYRDRQIEWSGRVLRWRSDTRHRRSLQHAGVGAASRV